MYRYQDSFGDADVGDRLHVDARAEARADEHEYDGRRGREHLADFFIGVGEHQAERERNERGYRAHIVEARAVGYAEDDERRRGNRYEVDDAHRGLVDVVAVGLHKPHVDAGVAVREENRYRHRGDSAEAVEAEELNREPRADVGDEKADDYEHAAARANQAKVAVFRLASRSKEQRSDEGHSAVAAESSGHGAAYLERAGREGVYDRRDEHRNDHNAARDFVYLTQNIHWHTSQSGAAGTPNCSLYVAARGGAYAPPRGRIISTSSAEPAARPCARLFCRR